MFCFLFSLERSFCYWLTCVHGSGGKMHCKFSVFCFSRPGIRSVHGSAGGAAHQEADGGLPLQGPGPEGEEPAQGHQDQAEGHVNLIAASLAAGITATADLVSSSLFLPAALLRRWIQSSLPWPVYCVSPLSLLFFCFCPSSQSVFPSSLPPPVSVLSPSVHPVCISSVPPLRSDIMVTVDWA